MSGLREDEREALVEAIYQGRLRNCAETIEGWGKGGHGLLMRVLRAESVRFVADAEPALLDILAARAAQTDARIARVEALADEWDRHRSDERTWVSNLTAELRDALASETRA